MNILEKIVARKRSEIEEAKSRKTISQLEKEVLFARNKISLASKIRDTSSPAIISEFKRKSPYKGIINGEVTPQLVTADYVKAGAAGLSVLTDTDFFGGSFDDFLLARNANPSVPMLRKDFMVDEYQLFEAKAIGADVILLIAACLQPDEIRFLSKRAHELGMEVLLEVHDQDELSASLGENIDMVGVNNRNLKTFETSIETSLALSSLIPDSFVKISESGLKDAETIWQLYQAGYKGFLIGETFMKTANPGTALADLQTQITQHGNLNPLVL